MKKASVFFTILIPFLVSALYLCPCKVSAAENISLAQRSHDCCERMKNCPVPKEASKGMQSMLSVPHYQDSRVEVFSYSTEVPIDFAGIQIHQPLEPLSRPYLNLSSHSTLLRGFI